MLRSPRVAGGVFGVLLSAALSAAQSGLVTFSGKSFVGLTGQAADLRAVTGLSFRSCEYGTLLEEHGQTDSLELDLLTNGTLRLIVRAGGGQTDYELTAGAGLNDNRWHSVWLVYGSGGRLSLEVDGREAALVASERPPLRADILSARLAGANQLVGKNFRGCLLRGPNVLLEDPGAQAHNVIRGQCALPDTGSCDGYNYGQPSVCFSQPCQHGARCIPSADGTAYTCDCSRRYTGHNCELDTGPLCSRPEFQCVNDGVCQEDWTGERTVCLCQEGFSGDRCETAVQSCIANPCLNGGRCSMVDGVQICTCQIGYAGQYCENPVDDCTVLERPCLHEGECIDKDNGFLCDCRGTGYEGERCENNVDECQSSPCANGATCFDQYPDYMCACPPGWQGRHCEQDVDECAMQPCLNGGKCANKRGGHQCLCKAGFTGADCGVNIDECVTASCPENAECVDGVNRHQCVCRPGFSGDESGCRRLDSCEPDPCQNGAQCRLKPAGPVCQCTAGYTGPTCAEPLAGSELAQSAGVALRQSPPACQSAPCANGATCVPEEESAAGFVCRCRPGFSGLTCEQSAAGCPQTPCLNGGTCSDTGVCQCPDQLTGDYCETSTNACTSVPCLNGADCVQTDTEQQYYCECRTGFEGLTCEHNIDDCRGVQCAAGHICFDLVNGYECRCPDGFNGSLCDQNIDDCAGSPCQNGGTCDDAVNDYQCICPPGYTGRNCTDDVDECEGDHPCVNGICVNNVGSFLCYCRPGFLGDHCNLDYDECLSQPCRHNGTCENLINGYSCQCQPGFTGKDCEVNINECEPDPCQNNATCVDGIASYECACLPGFTGARCQTNIDECESAPCLNNGACIDGINMFTCNCNGTGFHGDTCEMNIDDCEPQPCRHGSTCVDLVNDYRCQCYPGYEGKNCETDIAECLQSPCQNGASCVEKSNSSVYGVEPAVPGLPASYNFSTAGGYLCLCLPGFAGADCEQDIDECASSPCQSGDCLDAVNMYTCSCWPGYEGDHCQTEVDECDRYQPCVHGSCEDRVADYRCLCEPGYGGKNCSVELVGCRGVACQNGATCRPYVERETDHLFRCLCPPGFHGQLCGRQTTASFSGGSQLEVRSQSQADNYTLSVRFRTTLPDGLLALGQARPGSDAFFRLRLSAGAVNVFSTMQNDQRGLTVGGGLHDAGWHHVQLTINGSAAGLTVDGVGAAQPLRVSSSDDTHFASTLFGHAADSRLQPFINTTGFVGCMQDIMVDGVTTVPAELPPQQQQNLTLGCPRTEQCDPNPCLNSGTCVDLWSQNRCECARPFLGDICDKNITAATFDHEDSPGSLVSVTVDPGFSGTLSSYVDISLFARTREPSGLLFYLGTDASDVLTGDISYLAAELVDGRLQLHVKLEAQQGEQLLDVPSPRLDDGNNNLIRVIRNGTSLRAVVNGVQVANGTLEGAGRLSAEVLYLGHVPDLSRRRKRQIETTERGVQPSFKGSIQDVRIVNSEGQTRLVEFFPLEDPLLRLPAPLGPVNANSVLPGSVSDDTCRQQPCDNNGTCSVTWNDFSCTCPRGYKGHTCTELEYCVWRECPAGSQCRDLADGHECVANATFNGANSSAAYTAQLGGSSEMALASLSVRYRSRAGGRLLTVPSAGITLTLTAEGAELRWPGGRLLAAPQADLLSGEWRTLQLSWDELELRAAADGAPLPPLPLPAPLPALGPLLSDGEPVVMLGAAGDGAAPYRGCLAELRLGGLLLPFLSDAAVNSSAAHRWLLVDPPTALEPDCTVCYQHECEHGGYCAAPHDQFQCTCPDGFTGATCQNNIDECLLDNQCTNGATCVDGVNAYTCLCVPGYVGVHCETEVDECASLPCQNGATCQDRVNNYTCLCTDDYIGPSCEQMKVVNCTHQPCQHGGQCENVYSGGVAVNYTCTCQFGYEGRDCELVTDFCLPEPCLNGATCLSKQGTGFTCLCQPGFEGTTCERDVDECASSPCSNGATCADQINSFVCYCADGWTGRLCENDIHECDFAPCLNGGNCTELPGSFSCTCPQMYCGRVCGLNNHCFGKEEDSCKNGGVCVPYCLGNINNYGIHNTTCQCIDGYYGPTCEERSRTGEIVMVVAPVLSILLLAAVVGVVIFTTMAKNKRATRGTYSPSRQEMFNPRVEMGNMKKPPPEERLI